MAESLIFSLNSTMPMFFMMLLGYILHRRSMLDDRFAVAANRFVCNFTLPLLLFRDLATTDIRASFDARYVLFCAGVTASSILVIWALARLLLRDKRIIGEFVQACYRSSAAILGAAFIQNIYGTSGMSGLMIIGSVPLYNIFAVLILTLESPTLTDKSAGSLSQRLSKSLKAILRNPILQGVVFGFLVGLIHPTFPVVVDKTLSQIAGLTSPLALLCIGAGFKGRAALGYLRPTLAATCIKLIVLPALFLPLAVRLGFTDQKLIALLVMLGSITTPASYVMARQFGHEGTLTGSVCACTTVLSAVTLTWWLFWARSHGYIL